MAGFLVTVNWSLVTDLLVTDNRRHRRKQPLDVLGARQAMVAILDQGQDDVVAGEPRNQSGRELPRHAVVPGAMQDVHRTARLDQALAEEVSGAVLDQLERHEVVVPVVFPSLAGPA